MTRLSRLYVGIGVLLVGVYLAIQSVVAFAEPSACASRVNNTHAKLLECVSLDGVRSHQAEFQSIADDNNGIHTSGTPGYDMSADYVAATIRPGPSCPGLALPRSALSAQRGRANCDTIPQ